VAGLDDLLTRIADSALRAALERELAPLRGHRELGLVNERHLPETVRLPGLAIRRGVTVEVRADLESPTWQVTSVEGSQAHPMRKQKNGTQVTGIHPLDQLVRVQESGSPLYPGLRSVGRQIEPGGDRPFHLLINAENCRARWPGADAEGE